jgi:hypothetical protein
MADLSQRYYSPRQILVAAFLGSPLAGGYLASRNYSVFGTSSKATVTWVVSILLFIGLLALGYVLPKELNHLNPVIIALVAVGYQLHANLAFAPEIARLQSEGWVAHSWWRVVGLSLAIVTAAMALIFCVLLMLNVHAA